MKAIKLHIPQMDCPGEENLIRLKLQNEISIKNLNFDLQERKLLVYFDSDKESVLNSLKKIPFSFTVESESEINDAEIIRNQNNKKALITVLSINFFFFLVEISAGLISSSMGLIADSLDNLADAFVYGLSLYAVYSIASMQKNIAKFSGYIQLALALIGGFETVRRFLGFSHIPEFSSMIIFSFITMLGNIASLYILTKNKSSEVHMKASKIFTANDILINLGVIIAGILVYFTSSKYPDLIIGTIIFIIVFSGSRKILSLAK